jgi:hypothetical protein
VSTRARLQAYARLEKACCATDDIQSGEICTFEASTHLERRKQGRLHVTHRSGEARASVEFALSVRETSIPDSLRMKTLMYGNRQFRNEKQTAKKVLVYYSADADPIPIRPLLVPAGIFLGIQNPDRGAGFQGGLGRKASEAAQFLVRLGCGRRSAAPFPESKGCLVCGYLERRIQCNNNPCGSSKILTLALTLVQPDPDLGV